MNNTHNKIYYAALIFGIYNIVKYIAFFPPLDCYDLYYLIHPRFHLEFCVIPTIIFSVYIILSWLKRKISLIKMLIYITLATIYFYFFIFITTVGA